MNPLIRFQMMTAIQNEYLKKDMTDVQFADMLSERLGEKISYAQVRAARVILKVYPKTLPTVEVCNLLHDVRQTLIEFPRPSLVVREALILRINDVIGDNKQIADDA